MKTGKSLAYNGLHFVPTDRRLTDSFFAITKHLRSTDNNRLRVYNGGRWNHDSFYKKAAKMGWAEKDTFICLEDGREYCPGTNEMFLYE